MQPTKVFKQIIMNLILQAVYYSISVFYYSTVKHFILMFFFEDTLFIEESLIAPYMSFLYTRSTYLHVFFFSVFVTFNPPVG